MSNLFKPLEEGYQLDVNSAIFKAWYRFKENFFLYVLVGVLFFIVNFLISQLPYMSFLGNFISVILFSGFYIYSKNKDHGRQQNLDFFQGYLNIAGLVLYQMVLMILVVPLLMISMSSIIPIESFFDLLIGQVDLVSFSEQINGELENVGTNIILGI